MWGSPKSKELFVRSSRVLPTSRSSYFSVDSKRQLKNKNREGKTVTREEEGARRIQTKVRRHHFIG